MKRSLLIALLMVGLIPNADAAQLTGMPKVLDQNNIYTADRPNNFSKEVKNDPALIYVPNTLTNTVQVFDQKTYKMLRRVKVGREPQHVVPSWDLKTLYANSDKGDLLTPFNPKTGLPGKPIKVLDPYNLYFTPNGKYAVVMSEAMKEIVFRDPHTFVVKRVVKTNCNGVNHADWSADGTTFVATCEFNGTIIEVDTAKMKVLRQQFIPDSHTISNQNSHAGLPNMGPQPQDIKLSPDGKTYYIADMMSDGVWMMPAPWGKLTFIHTGIGAHGLYVTRDAKYLVVANRNDESISRIQFSNHKVISTWKIKGATPDMGGISADGKIFWVSGRYDNHIYAISLIDGHLIKKIRTDGGPHGLAVWPQPGRYSLGHTGIMR